MSNNISSLHDSKFGVSNNLLTIEEVVPIFDKQITKYTSTVQNILENVDSYTTELQNQFIKLQYENQRLQRDLFASNDELN